MLTGEKRVVILLGLGSRDVKSWVVRMDGIEVSFEAT